MLNNLKSLAMFAKVAETRSFSKAAVALGVSAPVVSQHISQLEAQLNAALVYRSTRSLSLTDAGERLATHAQRMLEAAEDGLEEIEEETQEVSGRLSITAPSFLATDALTDLFIAFQAEHPKVDLCITYSTHIVNLIESGIDLAIRVGELKDSNLRARKLLDGHGEIYASPGFLKENGAIKTPADLKNYEGKWVVPYQAEGNFLHRDDGSEDPVPFQFDGPFQSDNGEQVRQFALKGVGLAMLPGIYVEEDLKAGRLVRVLPGWVTEPMGVYAVWPHNVTHRSLTKLFVDYLVNSEFIKNA